MTSASKPLLVWSPNRSIRRAEVSWLCVHWTGGTFASAVDWCLRDESDVSYHAIISPAGEVRLIVPWDRAAWAVGVAKSPDARITFGYNSNHSSESIALAGGPPTKPTPAATAALIPLLVERMVARGWTAEETWRILGHDQVATFAAGHPKAGQFGRKPDPQGSRWLPLEPVREAVAALLRARSS